MKLGRNLGTPARDLESSIIEVLFALYSDKPMWLGISTISPFIVFYGCSFIYFYTPLFYLSFLLKCTCGGCLDKRNKYVVQTLTAVRSGIKAWSALRCELKGEIGRLSTLFSPVHQGKLVHERAS